MNKNMRVFTLAAVFVTLLGFAVSVRGQFRIAPVTKIGDSITCHVGAGSYQLTPDHSLISAISITGKAEETQKLFDTVSGYTELRANILTVPVTNDWVNVEICPGDVNYIAYNAKWVISLYKETHSLWVLYALMAHEIGHYVKGHALTAVGSNPKVELEADEYAGEILAKMGARLDDAQAAFKSEKMRSEGHSHPQIDQRLAAVEKGWNLGKATDNTSSSSTTITIPIKVNVSVNGNRSNLAAPTERENIVYKGGTNNHARFRFKTALVEGNTDDLLKKTAWKITKESGTHVWDNRRYAWNQPGDGRNLLLTWKDLTSNSLGWVVVQDYKDHWFYKANDDRGKWHLIEQGQPAVLAWNSSGQRITISFYTLPPSERSTSKDIQYSFGY